MRNFLFVIVLGCQLLSAHAQAGAPMPPMNYPLSRQHAVVSGEEQKTSWFTGGMCYIQRSVQSPELMTFITTVGEYMNASAIRSCISMAQKQPWRKVVIPPILPADTLREARTQNMACVIVGVVNTPLMYQVRFTSLDLTGEDREIADCMNLAGGSRDRALPVPTGREYLTL